jgi:class 3 adenylate cyclase
MRGAAGTLGRVSDPPDVGELQAAGIANPRERADLIKYLDELGFTVEEMAEAERRGRLFGLAGDVLAWSGRPIYTLQGAAEELGISADDVARAWSLLGLTVAGPDVPVLSQADVDALATWLALKAVVGEDGAHGLLRVLGAAMARLAEAEGTMIRAGTPDIQMNYTHDELATAQAYRAVAEFVPRLGSLIDVVHRHHLTSARTYFEGVLRDSSSSVECGIGFADLSSFTALTQALTPAELSNLLTEFGATVADVVHADGGRVVKFIGDAVMWVLVARGARAGGARPGRPSAGPGGGPARARGPRLRRGAGHQRRLFRHPGQPGRPARGGRGAGASPGLRRAARQVAGLARRRARPVDAQGF